MSHRKMHVRIFVFIGYLRRPGEERSREKTLCIYLFNCDKNKTITMPLPRMFEKKTQILIRQVKYGWRYVFGEDKTLVSTTLDIQISTKTIAVSDPIRTCEDARYCPERLQSTCLLS